MRRMATHAACNVRVPCLNRPLLPVSLCNRIRALVTAKTVQFRPKPSVIAARHFSLLKEGSGRTTCGLAGSPTCELPAGADAPCKGSALRRVIEQGRWLTDLVVTKAARYSLLSGACRESDCGLDDLLSEDLLADSE